jgi:hypothetical protein
LEFIGLIYASDFCVGEGIYVDIVLAFAHIIQGELDSLPFVA